MSRRTNRRTLPGWTHGPHDTLVRIHPQAIHGYRFTRATSGRKTAGGTDGPASR
jgi:hypothetical protein